MQTSHVEFTVPLRISFIHIVRYSYHDFINIAIIVIKNIHFVKMGAQISG